MERNPSSAPRRLLAALAFILIAKVTLSVVLGYRDYFPPNFDADFLLGRAAYFWGAYRWFFYAHLVSGPLSLLLGMILVSDRFRQRLPHWHRWLGRLQAVNVLLLVVPSGLWMSWYAATGVIAGAGLAALSIATAVFISLGVRAAIGRRFAEHRRWMWRTFVLLCSAVIIRMIGGLATVAQFDALWLYPLSAWASWLVPLMIFEVIQRKSYVTSPIGVPGEPDQEPTHRPLTVRRASPPAPSSRRQSCSPPA
jgi:hypothetical protein